MDPSYRHLPLHTLPLPTYSEGTVRDIDRAPADDDCVFDGLLWHIHTDECVVPVIFDLDVDRNTLCILERNKQKS